MLEKREDSSIRVVDNSLHEELEKMIHKKVLLKTFVKVNKNWNNNAQYISSLGVGSNQDAS